MRINRFLAFGLFDQFHFETLLRLMRTHFSCGRRHAGEMRDQRKRERKEAVSLSGFLLSIEWIILVTAHMRKMEAIVTFGWTSLDGGERSVDPNWGWTSAALNHVTAARTSWQAVEPIQNIFLMAAFFIGTSKARLITFLFSSRIPISAYLLILKRPPTRIPTS